ncbi:NUDIX domain-containing protein [Ectobacillus ponti]|uniref:NUDIX hydrolase n=1 Tax=Ectobacillus ponti TaxID=2961894 RepID=A0AA41X9S8_9BACI|nr:NUDIX hydrolase [Ectobacillus ponti]MCP8969798.1 NUDIX hydrolase [Ectobacillus ponti]
MEKRGKVWLAVSGLVTTGDGRWLVVKKKYGGLKGKWSLPAGFVNAGETVDQAVQREVLEETGIETELVGMLGMRSGVIRGDISDNMILFALQAKHENIVCQDKELFEARFLHPENILRDGDASVLIRHLVEALPKARLRLDDRVNPGDHFGYTAYHLFLP